MHADRHRHFRPSPRKYSATFTPDMTTWSNISFRSSHITWHAVCEIRANHINRPNQNDLCIEMESSCLSILVILLKILTGAFVSNLNIAWKAGTNFFTHFVENIEEYDVSDGYDNSWVVCIPSSQIPQLVHDMLATAEHSCRKIIVLQRPV